MTARQKIETLTNAWYGYAFFTSLVGLVENGFGVGSIIGAALGLGLQLILIWFIGRRLLSKSSLTRVLLVAFSGIAGLVFTIGTAKFGWAAITDFSLTALIAAFFSGTAVAMYIRSFRTLTDSSVKAYFG
jgi:hypothetical protein